VSVDKEKPSNYSVVLNFKGERTILVYHQPRYYSLPELKGAQWIYYTSLGNNYENLQEKLLTFLKAHKGIKLAFNPGTHQLKKELKGMKEVLKRCEIVFLNKEEAERIVGQAKGMTGLLEKLKATGPKIAVITDGVKGAYAFDGKEVWYLPSFPLKAIEKTGAGDSFATGFVAARFHGQPIPEALRWGAANATSVVQKIGPQDGLLTRQGVEEMLKRFEKIAPERKNL
jgi:sugar/nucleoside kinase (ribokinase family)